MSKINNNRILLILAIISIFILIPTAFAGEIDENVGLDDNAVTDAVSNTDNQLLDSGESLGTDYELSQEDLIKEKEINLSYNKVKDSVIADSNSIYVSNDGNDDSADGTEANPYKTISKAVEIYNSSINSNIFIKNGEYLLNDTILPLLENLMKV